MCETCLSPPFLPPFPLSSEDSTLLAASLSTHALKLYSPLTGDFLGDLRGHLNTITDLSFCAAHTLLSSSADGTVRMWDVRMRAQVSAMRRGKW